MLVLLDPSRRTSFVIFVYYNVDVKCMWDFVCECVVSLFSIMNPYCYFNSVSSIFGHVKNHNQMVHALWIL